MESTLELYQCRCRFHRWADYKLGCFIPKFDLVSYDLDCGVSSLLVRQFYALIGLSSIYFGDYTWTLRLVHFPWCSSRGFTDVIFFCWIMVDHILGIVYSTFQLLQISSFWIISRIVWIRIFEQRVNLLILNARGVCDMKVQVRTIKLVHSVKWRNQVASHDLFSERVMTSFDPTHMLYALAHCIEKLF